MYNAFVADAALNWPKKRIPLILRFGGCVAVVHCFQTPSCFFVLSYILQMFSSSPSALHRVVSLVRQALGSSYHTALLTGHPVRHWHELDDIFPLNPRTVFLRIEKQIGIRFETAVEHHHSHSTSNKEEHARDTNEDCMQHRHRETRKTLTTAKHTM